MKYRTGWWAAAAATLGLAAAAAFASPPSQRGAMHGERHAAAPQQGCMGEHQGEQHAMRDDMRGHDGMPEHRQGGMHGYRQGAAEGNAPPATPPTQ